MAKRVRAEWTPPAVGVVHWDGKAMPSLRGGPSTEERLPVLVSGTGGTKLLGVPALPKGLGEGQTGGAIADATMALLQERNAKDCIAAMAFDTTSANTGKY